MTAVGTVCGRHLIGYELKIAMAVAKIATDWLHLPAQAEGSILSCDQLWRTHIEGQARVKAEQSSSTQTGEKQAALRRGLHAQMAAHAYLPDCLGSHSADSIFEESEG